VHTDRLRRIELGFCCGIASVLLFGFFYAATIWRGNPGQAPVSVYFIFVVLPIIVALSIVCSLIATFMNSKWWLIIAIVSGLYAFLWFGTSSV
jgi:ABC-type transport system involved in Fe-S cluster assembly fused permease/ATPase subunit